MVNYALFKLTHYPQVFARCSFSPLERQFIEFIEREQDHGEARQNQQCVRDHPHGPITACHPAGFKAASHFPRGGQRVPGQNARGEPNHV